MGPPLILIEDGGIRGDEGVWHGRMRAESFRSVRLFGTPCTVACQVPLSRQEYWSGLPFPSPGDPPDPGIEPASLMSPALADGSLPRVPPGRETVPIMVEEARWMPDSAHSPSTYWSIFTYGREKAEALRG